MEAVVGNNDEWFQWLRREWEVKKKRNISANVIH